MTQKRLSAEGIKEVMWRRNNIRNMSVIAHVDHGKSTLTDSLLSRAGLLSASKTGSRETDTRKDEAERCISIKSTAISMYYRASKQQLEFVEQPREFGDESDCFLVNLIDSPGHVDFSSEVTAALRVTDGALVVVDCVSGVCVQTEMVLRQAMSERIKPVLFMNKMDLALTTLQLDPEQLYLKFQKVLEDINVLLATYSDGCEAMGKMEVDPAEGSVGFGSGLQGWAFSLADFGRLYEKKFGVSAKKMTKKLWGEHFYNVNSQKWSRGGSQEAGAVRSFVHFVLDPIYKMMKACQSNKVEALELAKKLNVILTVEESDLSEGKELFSAVMRKWLPAGDALLEMIIVHLPSPVVAQSYRTELLYEGPMDDAAAVAMRHCDPKGPLMMYVSKNVPSKDNQRFYSFGRVFSGTVESGLRVRVMGPNYEPGGKRDLYEKKLTGAMIMMGRNVLGVDGVPCGNVCALAGVDQYLVKTGTISTYENAHNLKVMKFSVSAVVRAAVSCVQAADLPRLVEGLRRLDKSDAMVECSIDESGEHVIAAAGELHLEVCVNDLRDIYARVPLKVSETVIALRETVAAEVSDRTCLAKSNNKHNRIWVRAQPLSELLVADVDDGAVSATWSAAARAEHLVDRHGWDVATARKVWCFGPEGSGPNVVVDATSGATYLNEARDSLQAGFQWATKEGALCEESMRGCRFDVDDVTIHRDAAHRRGAQLIPAARRAFLAAQLASGAALVEPVYAVDVQCKAASLGAVHAVLGQRRAVVVDVRSKLGSPLLVLRANLACRQSFGLASDLRGRTGGDAVPQCTFSHWQRVPGDLYQPGSDLHRLVSQVRARKGLNPRIPVVEDFSDKL